MIVYEHPCPTLQVQQWDGTLTAAANIKEMFLHSKDTDFLHAEVFEAEEHSFDNVLALFLVSGDLNPKAKALILPDYYCCSIGVDRDRRNVFMCPPEHFDDLIAREGWKPQ